MSTWQRTKKRRGPEEEANYIAMIEFNFGWHRDDIHLVEEMWKAGESGYTIADCVGRPPEEVAILIMDRVCKGNLKERPGGWFGNERRRGAWTLRRSNR